MHFFKQIPCVLLILTKFQIYDSTTAELSVDSSQYGRYPASADNGHYKRYTQDEGYTRKNRYPEDGMEAEYTVIQPKVRNIFSFNGAKPCHCN